MLHSRMFKTRRALSIAFWGVALAVISQVAVAGLSPAGHYRINEGPDTASELLLRADGTFQYFFSAGALDEQARGVWKVSGSKLKLTTVPKPVPAVFSKGLSSSTKDSGLEVHVTDPAGRGIALVDFTLGFDTGQPINNYTQDGGWRMDRLEKRTPRWIELSLPINNVQSNRFAVDLTAGNRLNFILTANDLGTVDFNGVQIDIMPRRLVVHRFGALLRYEASEESAH